ncbi:hypothetical protein [Microbacterium timonense]|uniref:hypothetical protein n=1 Tax=Microbacterium timonense TaxID=2086576 RepID=UPI000D0FC33C|nr:hypothetical protein [Microbacterium timonense]
MTPSDGILGAPYRVVRAVRAREDGPWPGTLVRAADGESRVLVDAVTLGEGWSGWDAAPEGHVLAALDVARRTDGHDVVLPLCVERLDDFVGRRARRAPLSPGEAVTLGVSVLRGCAQVIGRRDITGEWWLDDSGRPILATEATADHAFDGAVGALQRAAVDPELARVWDDVLRSLTAERVSLRELSAAEDALFAVAAPEPLSTVNLAPRQAAGTASPAHAVSRADGSGGPPDPPARPLWHSLIAGVDDDLADSVSRATTAVWRRLRADRPPRSPRRRTPWLVGGAVAAAVLAGGALWPSAGGVATGTAAQTAPPPADDAVGTRTGSGNDTTTATPEAGEPGARAAPTSTVSRR